MPRLEQVNRTLLLLAVVGCCDACYAQRGLRSSLLFGPSGLLEMLAREDVRSELELLDDQVRQLGELRSKFRRLARDRFSQLRESGVEGARRRAAELVESLNRDLEADLAAILLPHQSRRLAQLQLQRQLAGSRPGEILSNKVAKQLSITDDQREQIRAKQRELDADFRRQVAALRAAARDEVMKLLTPTQQQRLQELVGRPFRFDDQPANEPLRQP